MTATQKEKLKKDFSDFERSYGWVIRYAILLIVAYAVMWGNAHYVRIEQYREDYATHAQEIRESREALIEIRTELRHINEKLGGLR